jgi:NAD(P)-dependent dehydrogenase (short-subunit alcohol dehydrogenase family)
MTDVRGEGEGELAGKVAIVTGAGARDPHGVGNGRAIAVLLARAGARVALADIQPEWAVDTERLINAENGTAMTVAADVGDPDSCRACVGEVIDRWGRADILVNNVGISGPKGTAADVDLTDWDACLRINVTSMMLMARECIPHMRLQGAGSIVNIASVAGLIGGHPTLAYPTTKGAVVNMTRAMAAHHGLEGIRVNTVAPGAVYTPMIYTRDATAETRDRRRLRSLLQIEGTAWDVAEAVMFLAGPRARWITGVVLPVDAGATAGTVKPPLNDTVPAANETLPAANDTVPAANGAVPQTTP